MRRAVVLAPVFAGAFPVLFLYAHNVDEVTASAAAPVLTVVVAFAAVLTAGFYGALRDLERASLAATVCVLLFLMYGHVFDFLIRLMPAGLVLGHWLVLPLLAMFAALGALPLFKHRRHVAEIMSYVTLALGALVVFNLASIVIPEFQRIGGSPGSGVLAPVGETEGADIGYLPDIYYIVPDRYPNSSTLENYFGYDNSAFIEYLEDTGFYVADQSLANYHETFLSLASSLNFDYLDDLSDSVGIDVSDKTPAFAMLEDNATWRTLKEQFGYKYVHFGSWWGPTESNPHADVEINKHPRLFGLWELNNEFARQVFWTSALRPFNEIVLARDSFSQRDAVVDRCKSYSPRSETPPNDMAGEQCHRTLYALQQLREMPHAEGPKLVFVHLLLPHPPFIFGPEGDLVEPPPYYYWDNLTPEQLEELTSSFTDQLTYTNTVLKDSIDHILAASPQPPIIVLQADEGPWTLEYVQKERHELSADTLQVRHGILNAYYLPGADLDILYPSISPVNTFRMIFNEYFGAEMPLLEDRAFRSAHWARPYEFVEVTDQLRTGWVVHEDSTE